MVDLNMPDGMTDEQRRSWLKSTGEALVAETGQPSGVTEPQEGRHGQPVWAIWWTDDRSEESPEETHDDDPTMGHAQPSN